MFKKKFRLGKSKKRLSQSFNTPLFSLRVEKNNLDYSRFGFIVSKKVDKRAVVRNRVKRVFRSSVEDRQDKIKEGFDMLFFLRKGLFDKTKEETSGLLESFLRDKGFIK